MFDVVAEDAGNRFGLNAMCCNMFFYDILTTAATQTRSMVFMCSHSQRALSFIVSHAFEMNIPSYERRSL